MRWTLLAFLIALGLFLLGPASIRAEDPPEGASGEEEADEEEEDLEIVWLDDIEEAREKAKADGKGVFVYLTPSWFT